MKERPILFRGEMVKAILDGRKKMMRRPLKLQPAEYVKRIYFDKEGTPWMTHKIKGQSRDDALMGECPYGEVGDRLWVREACSFGTRRGGPSMEVLTAWQGSAPKQPPEGAWVNYAADYDPEDGGWLLWRSSIHMPRWASRILLEITSVRVERIRNISAADTVAEGYPIHDTTMDGFGRSWKATYPGSWDRNDWVWVIEFKKI